MWWDAIHTQVLTIYVCMLQFSLKTATIKGVFFQLKIEFSCYMYVYEVF